MNSSLNVRSLVARILMAALTSTAVLPAKAELMSTEGRVPSDRDRVAAVIGRSDVRMQLEARGVTVSEAKERVAALTDAEVAQLLATAESAPAGGMNKGEQLYLAIMIPIYIIAFLIAKIVMKCGEPGRPRC